MQSYSTGVAGMFALNLDPDGTSFWTGSFINDNLYRFDIASGTLLKTFNTGSGGDSLFGVSVFGEITQVGGVPEPASIVLFGTILGLAGISIRRKIRAS